MTEVNEIVPSGTYDNVSSVKRKRVTILDQHLLPRILILCPFHAAAVKQILYTPGHFAHISQEPGAKRETNSAGYWSGRSIAFGLSLVTRALSFAAAARVLP